MDEAVVSLSEEKMEDLDVTEEDLALLSSLGANAVDREIFEQDFLDKLEEEFQLLESKKSGLGIESVLNQTSELNSSSAATASSSSVPTPRDESKESDIVKNESVEDLERQTSKSKSDEKNDAPSSILQNLLQREETDSEKKIRLGEMTPFGAVVETKSEKKGSFQNLETYLQTQIALGEQFKQTRKVHKKKRREPSESEDEEESVPRPSTFRSSESQPRTHLKGHRKSKKSKEPLNMNVMFPKKRKRKAVLGTETSEDPRDARRRAGTSTAEQNSIYLNASDDSEYVPSESEGSGAEFESTGREKLARRPTKKRKVVVEVSGSESSEYETDEDYEKPSRRSKKETDDGNVKYYQQRVQQWKENETRFTNEVYTMDGGFKLPMHIWDNLYNYQKVGVKWFWELHQQRSGGILGDEMGLGKTIQVICFLAGLSCSNILFRFEEFRGLGPSLIICPATVMHQWVQEFHKWWPPFRVAILHESGSYSGTKQGFIRSVHESKGILVTTYTSLVKNQNELLRYNWHYVILDEGHKIRNPDALITLAIKQVKTPHRIILSGSPLQNNLKELWSLFDFIFPGKLGTLPVFMEQFAVPITQGGYANASDIQVAAAFKCATTLRDLISPYLLRRMKSDVSKHLNLPQKNEQVLFCKLTDDQKKLYQDYLKTDEIGKIIDGRHNIFIGLIHLRKICNHPHLFDGGPKLIKSVKRRKHRTREDESEDEDLKRRVPKNKGRRGSSSLSLSLSPDEEESDIELDPNDSFGHWTKSGKMVVVKTLLKLWKRQEHKVLLFTQSRQMLCILENFVKQENYSYLRLDGSTSIGSRQPMIQKFNEDPSIFVFILTTRVGGLGVNLTGANRVILFDPDWNPSTDLQARERAWRIGQERQVTIYRLITAGTIEEKIYHRQIFKQFLTNRVLKDPRQKRFFKSNDMMELFTYNDGSEGTETEAIFAGTESSVSMPKSQRTSRRAREEDEPREKSTGKFRGIPNLVKQRAFKAGTEESALDSEKNQMSHRQDEYVLRKLFKKSGVEGALKHDKIMDASEPDYLIVEKEAERVAKDAIKVLKRSREQCWAPETGRVTWTGAHGSVRPSSSSRTKRLEPDPKPSTSKRKELEDPTANFFSHPKLPLASDEDWKNRPPLSSKELIAIMRSHTRSLIPTPPPRAPEQPFPGDDLVVADPPPPVEDKIVPDVKSEYVELLREIREFIAFRAMVDGQASTAELLSEFGDKLPAKDSPLFKQMLNQLCTHRQVDGQRIWRLKLEFR